VQVVQGLLLHLLVGAASLPSPRSMPAALVGGGAAATAELESPPGDVQTLLGAILSGVQRMERRNGLLGALFGYDEWDWVCSHMSCVLLHCIEGGCRQPRQHMTHVLLHCIEGGRRQPRQHMTHVLFLASRHNCSCRHCHECGCGNCSCGHCHECGCGNCSCRHCHECGCGNCSCSCRGYLRATQKSTVSMCIPSSLQQVLRFLRRTTAGCERLLPSGNSSVDERMWRSRAVPVVTEKIPHPTRVGIAMQSKLGPEARTATCCTCCTLPAGRSCPTHDHQGSVAPRSLPLQTRGTVR
jgi:hypothetical protein